MSTVSNLSQAAGCGCAGTQEVQPSDLAVVPGGSVIVQAPVPGSCAPPSSSNAAVVQQAQQQANCENYANPLVLESFQVVGIDKTSTMLATCAGSWALPGLELYFSGLGLLEVVGVNNDVITYKNISIEEGTTILAGTGLHHDAPGTGPTGDGLDVDPNDVEASTTLDGLYGYEGNELKKIIPVDGQMLYGCGSKWVRRQVGQMRYPISPTVILNKSGSCANESHSITLPSKPSLPACSLAFGIEILVDLWLEEKAGGSYTDYWVETASGIRIVRAYEAEDGRESTDNCSIVVPLGSSDTSFNLESKEASGGGNGNYELKVTALAYHY